MLYGLLIAFYIFLCTVLMLLIMVQKGKSSMGLGSLGGGAQMLFGGSGGQDIFQKITWVLGALFMASSLVLALMKGREVKMFHYIKPSSAATSPFDEAPLNETRDSQDRPMSEPTLPIETSVDEETADQE